MSACSLLVKRKRWNTGQLSTGREHPLSEAMVVVMMIVIMVAVARLTMLMTMKTVVVVVVVAVLALVGMAPTAVGASLVDKEIFMKSMRSEKVAMRNRTVRA